jgi:hypothetical protein
MSTEETTEVAETSEVVETSEAPIEAAPEAEAVEAAPEAEAPEAEAPEAEAAEPEPVFDWNGEVNDLQQSEWLRGASPAVRSAVLRGIESKYRNWQRGYTDKFQELSGHRKLLDKREEDIRTQEARVQKWLHGDIDPLEDKQREIDELKTSHDSALRTLREEYAENVEKSKTASAAEYETLKAERDELHHLHQVTVESKAAAEKVQEEARIDDFEHWLKTEAPDVLGYEDAFYALCANCTAGFKKEVALQMVRGVWAAPAPEPEPEPPAEPEPVPEGMKLMNMGSGLAAGTDAGDVRTYEEMMSQMRRVAQTDEENFINSGNSR